LKKAPLLQPVFQPDFLNGVSEAANIRKGGYYGSTDEKQSVHRKHFVHFFYSVSSINIKNK